MTLLFPAESQWALTFWSQLSLTAFSSCQDAPQSSEIPTFQKHHLPSTLRAPAGWRNNRNAEYYKAPGGVGRGSVTHSFRKLIWAFFRCSHTSKLFIEENKNHLFERWRRWKSALHAKIQNFTWKFTGVQSFSLLLGAGLRLLLLLCLQVLWKKITKSGVWKPDLLYTQSLYAEGQEPFVFFWRMTDKGTCSI